MEIQKIKSIQSHEDSQCYYKQAVCGRKECEEISFPGKIKHIPECGFFLIICEACKKELKQSDVSIFFFIIIKYIYRKKLINVLIG